MNGRQTGNNYKIMQPRHPRGDKWETSRDKNHAAQSTHRLGEKRRLRNASLETEPKSCGPGTQPFQRSKNPIQVNLFVGKITYKILLHFSASTPSNHFQASPTISNLNLPNSLQKDSKSCRSQITPKNPMKSMRLFQSALDPRIPKYSPPAALTPRHAAEAEAHHARAVESRAQSSCRTRPPAELGIVPIHQGFPRIAKNPKTPFLELKRSLKNSQAR